MDEPKEFILINAARVVLIDPEDRVLLFRYTRPDDGVVFWATPGGGMEPGEDHETTARRELAEETGLTEVELGPLVWTRDHSSVWDGILYRKIEQYFIARVDGFELGPELTVAHERDSIDANRWWTLDELEKMDDLVAPRRLAALLRDLLEHGPPAEPFDVGT